MRNDPLSMLRAAGIREEPRYQVQVAPTRFGWSWRVMPTPGQLWSWRESPPSGWRRTREKAEHAGRRYVERLERPERRWQAIPPA